MLGLPRAERVGTGGVQADGDPQWLEWAYQLQHTMDSLFWDDRGGAPSIPRVASHVQQCRRGCLGPLHRSLPPVPPHRRSSLVSMSTWASSLKCRELQLSVCASKELAQCVGRRWLLLHNRGRRQHSAPHERGAPWTELLRLCMQALRPRTAWLVQAMAGNTSCVSWHAAGLLRERSLDILQ